MSNIQALDMWNERLCFIWYNDAQIFDFTDKDFDDLARSYSQSGITIAITFSCTHFRYSYMPYWDKIFTCLKRLCDACHKYGIKVVEHASCSLTHSIKTEDDIKSWNSTLNARGSTASTWEKVLPFAGDDNAVANNGKLMKDFRQIDGRTGEYADSGYRGFCFCYNNPDYRESYFMYLDELYKTGIDGIMADDIQYFASGNACTCDHCRRLFKEETGFDLPSPEKWNEFYGNFSDPAFVAWKRFKTKSTENYQRDINRHFESRGLKLIRPNYISNILHGNWSCYPFESASDLWDVTFQENCYPTPIRYCFPAYATEAIQRYAMCEWKDNPSLSMFYPDRYDSFYFSWALASTWGQKLLSSAENKECTKFEKIFRAFEKKYSTLYRNPKKIEDMAFYHSTQTRDFTDSSGDMSCFCSAVQSAYLAGYSVGMVFDYSEDEVFFKHKKIVCVCVTMVSDEELKKFSKFVEMGGELVIMGGFAKYRADGTTRTFEETKAFFGDSFEKITLIPEFDFKKFHGEIWISRSETVSVDFSHSAEIRNFGKESFKDIVSEKVIFHSAKDKELLLGAFKIKDGFAVNITNITDCIPAGTADVSHNHPVPAFVKGAKKLDGFSVDLKCSDKIRFAYIVSPEFEGAVALDFEEKDGYVKVNIPEGLFSGYGIVHLIRE